MCVVTVVETSDLSTIKIHSKVYFMEITGKLNDLSNPGYIIKLLEVKVS